VNPSARQQIGGWKGQVKKLICAKVRATRKKSASGRGNTYDHFQEKKEKSSGVEKGKGEGSCPTRIIPLLVERDGYLDKKKVPRFKREEEWRQE